MKIDLVDPATFAAGHPLAQYDWLRTNAPVYWHEEPEGAGFWAVTSYDGVYEVDRDFQTYSSEPTIMLEDSGIENAFGEYKMMLMMDPPQHTAFRRLIREEFLPKPTLGRIPRMQQLARQIVDGVIEKGSCDFVTEVAGEMPSYVIAELMGLPLSDGRELYKLTEIIHTSPSALPPGAGGQAVGKMFEYGMKIIAEKRARPADDLATKLLTVEVDGRKLADMEFLLFFMLLVDAGGDTTRNLLSAGLIELLGNPDQLAWLKADLQGRLPAAREELLRATTPVVYMRRTARKDAVLGGQQIRDGQKVVMFFGAANRDAAHFASPDRLNLARTPNDHMAFGNGPHVCLGQHIARIEIDAVLVEVLTRMEELKIERPPIWLQSNFIAGPTKLDVSFKAAKRLG
ncbi:Putative cytochrome P450 126 [Alphaproteobacteria bacterium SO-S41]|nr:Putative cytochrome P450 126 [Alphaproteobacteria bacterium SO-S41]